MSAQLVPFIPLDPDDPRPSLEQQRINEWFANGRGALVVRARAGSGKTHTILRAINFAPEQQILLAAFAKRNQEDFERKLRHPLAKAMTLHSAGLRVVSLFWPRIPIDKRGNRARALTELVCGAQVPDAVKKLVTKLHSKGREIAPHACQPGDLTDLAIKFDCEPSDEWLDYGYDLAWVEQAALKAMDAATKRKPLDTGIDYPDMIFLPIRMKWLRPRYGLVVVDEAQDMNAAQLELAQGLCRGRLVLVGDDRQAIYGFRGADSGSLDRLKESLHATELGLTVTYRCAKAIVALAQALVPDYQAHADNPEGTIDEIGIQDLPEDAHGGDAVLSRVNAPLMAVAMAFIRKQKRVKVIGRDIAARILELIEKLSKGRGKDSIPALLERLVSWEEREVTRATAAGLDETEIEQIRDLAETVHALTDGVSGVPELRARVDSLFVDDGQGDANTVICSSVHKAKGLEWNTVYVLRETLQGKQRKGTKAPSAAEVSEEMNIKYVSITRARRRLVWVDGLPG